MYEYRLCLYVCDLDVALFHSWLQGITSKSVKKSENSLLNPGGCFPRHGTRRTRAAVPHYVRAEVEWREGGTATMRKAFEWPTLFLIGIVSLDVGNSWPVAMQRANAAQVEWFS